MPMLTIHPRGGVGQKSLGLLFLLAVGSCFAAASSPRLYGGSCGVINSTLYFVGGMIDYNGDGKADTPASANYYTLDLSSSFDINDLNEAPWRNNTPVDRKPSLGSYGVVVPRNGEILLMGGGQIGSG